MMQLGIFGARFFPIAENRRVQFPSSASLVTKPAFRTSGSTTFARHTLLGSMPAV